MADAVADDRLATAARRLQHEDVIPTLTPPPELDLAEYGESILARFANSNLGHTTLQVTMDGSQKLPIRVLNTVADRLAVGQSADSAALVVAAWMVFIYRGHDVNGRPLPLNDPMAGELHAATADSEAGLAERMLGLGAVFPEEIAGDPGFRAAVQAQVWRLLIVTG